MSRNLMSRYQPSHADDPEFFVVARIAEELTNRPVGSLADLKTALLEHLVRYRRTQDVLTDVSGNSWLDPRAVDVFEHSVQLAERYTRLTRCVSDLSAR